MLGLQELHSLEGERRRGGGGRERNGGREKRGKEGGKKRRGRKGKRRERGRINISSQHLRSKHLAAVHNFLQSVRLSLTLVEFMQSISVGPKFLQSVFDALLTPWVLVGATCTREDTHQMTSAWERG